MTESVNPACFITVVCLTSLYLNFAFSMYFLIKTVTFISKETSVFFFTAKPMCALLSHDFNKWREKNEIGYFVR